MNNEMMKTTPAEASEILLWCFQTDTVPMLWGAPGIGKSSIVEQTVAEWTGEEGGFIDFRANLKEPVDMTGVPTVENGRTRWNPPSFLPNGKDEERGVLSIEELPNATRQMQAALYPLVYHPRRIDEYVFPEGWRIVLTGNRRQDGGGTYEMPTPLKNRLLHFEMEASVEQWCDYAIETGLSPLIVGFIRFRPELLVDIDHTKSAMPTPRTWEELSKILPVDALKIQSRKLNLLVQSAVGTGASTEFLSWLQEVKDIPPIQEFFDDPSKMEEYLDKPSVLYAILDLVARYAAAAEDERDGDRRISEAKRLPFPEEYQMLLIMRTVRLNRAAQTFRHLNIWLSEHSSLVI